MTVPLISPVVFFNLVLGVIATFSVFTFAYVATNGGPAYATWFYVLHLYYNAFDWLQMGYASALSWILFAILLGLHLPAVPDGSAVGPLRRRDETEDRCLGRTRSARRSDGARARTACELGFPRRHLLALVVLGALFAFPFFWQLISSFKDISEIQASPPSLLARQAPVGELHRGLDARRRSARFTVNTLTVAILATLGQTFSAAAVAYGFARFRFRGRDVGVHRCCLSSLMLPWEVTIVPQFILFRELGWLDTLAPLIVPHLVRRRGLQHLPAAPVLPHDPARSGRGGQDRRRRLRAGSSGRSCCRSRARR